MALPPKDQKTPTTAPLKRYATPTHAQLLLALPVKSNAVPSAPVLKQLSVGQLLPKSVSAAGSAAKLPVSAPPKPDAKLDSKYVVVSPGSAGMELDTGSAATAVSPTPDVQCAAVVPAPPPPSPDQLRRRKFVEQLAAAARTALESASLRGSSRPSSRIKQFRSWSVSPDMHIANPNVIDYVSGLDGIPVGAGAGQRVANCIRVLHFSMRVSMQLLPSQQQSWYTYLANVVAGTTHQIPSMGSGYDPWAVVNYPTWRFCLWRCPVNPLAAQIPGSVQDNILYAANYTTLSGSSNDYTHRMLVYQPQAGSGAQFSSWFARMRKNPNWDDSFGHPVEEYDFQPLRPDQYRYLLPSATALSGGTGWSWPVVQPQQPYTHEFNLKGPFIVNYGQSTSSATNPIENHVGLFVVSNNRDPLSIGTWSTQMGLNVGYTWDQVIYYEDVDP